MTGITADLVSYQQRRILAKKTPLEVKASRKEFVAGAHNTQTKRLSPSITDTSQYFFGKAPAGFGKAPEDDGGRTFDLAVGPP
jgi:hypothetical protein